MSEPAPDYMQLDMLGNNNIVPKVPSRDKIVPRIGKRNRQADHDEIDETERRPSQRIRVSDLLLMAAEVTDTSNEDQSEFSYHVNDKGEQVNVTIPIPANYRQAIEDPLYFSRWREAVRAELQSLIKFGTWDVAERDEIHPSNVAMTKWVFAVKYGSDGRVDRFKARLVVRGFTQRQGEDFEDTIAPVIRIESLRVLLAIAAEFGMKAHLLDATNAFVGSSLDIPNYKEIPQGLEEFESRALPKQKYVLQLRKSLYGLRQAAYL